MKRNRHSRETQPTEIKEGEISFIIENNLFFAPRITYFRENKLWKLKSVRYDCINKINL